MRKVYLVLLTVGSLLATSGVAILLVKVVLVIMAGCPSYLSPKVCAPLQGGLMAMVISLTVATFFVKTERWRLELAAGKRKANQ